MKSERIMVTGANGYIGRHVTYELLKRGYEVVATDIRCGDIEDRDNLSKIEVSIFDDPAFFVKVGNIDRCVHMAWRDGFVHNSNAHMEDLSKHYSFIKQLCENGVKSISIMGTMHEIGYWEGAIDENTPTNPQSMYGIAKNALRLSSKLLATNNNVSLKWLRAYYILGDDVKSNSIFSKIIKASQEGKTEFPFTTGKNLYDFITVDELAEQIVSASVQDEISGEINCCTGKPISLADRVEEFIRENNLKIRLQYGVFPDRKYDSPGVWGDSTKIEKIMKRQL